MEDSLKIGRPSTFSEELAQSICADLMAGFSLRTICKQEGMPACSTVFKWLSEKPLFSEQYARAREIQAELMADEIVAIADDGENDTYMKDDKELVNYDIVQRSKLRVDARKWVASKLLPKKYGDKVTQEIGGIGGGALTVAIKFEGTDGA